MIRFACSNCKLHLTEKETKFKHLIQNVSISGVMIYACITKIGGSCWYIPTCTLYIIVPNKLNVIYKRSLWSVQRLFFFLFFSTSTKYLLYLHLYFHLILFNFHRIITESFLLWRILNIHIFFHTQVWKILFYILPKLTVIYIINDDTKLYLWYT